MEKRRLVLIGTPDLTLQSSLKAYFEDQIDGSVVFVASDGTDLLIKASRTKPNLVVFSGDLLKTSAVDVYSFLKLKFAKDAIAFVFIGSELPEAFKDDYSLGSLIWVPSAQAEALSTGISQALNSLGETSFEFHVRHLAKGETLLKEGGDPHFFYFVISGSLQALCKTDGTNIQVGIIGNGEFVGEMGVINSEVRSATVIANESCQLLEIPARDFNKMVMIKPSWSRAIMSTLTRRLKIMNALTKKFDKAS